jgi:competence ComEA-like helix-hairpin-helix protein
MSPRTAAVGLLALAALGRLVLHWSGSGAPPGQVLAAPRPVLSPSAQRDSAARVAAPIGEGERVDLDRADASQLERLPGIGPALARRIVADRTAHGPFGGLAGLDRVPGVGPALLARIAPHAQFSGAPAGGSGADPGAGIRLLPGERLLMAPDTDPGRNARGSGRRAARPLP